ncbi:carbonic anhydrase [Streptomyces tendae]|uniref:carbonic anhydrase n=1 Tax=Streptomyces tendae TaxID=1932 RepID=UPI00371AAA3B
MSLVSAGAVRGRSGRITALATTINSTLERFDEATARQTRRLQARPRICCSSPARPGGSGRNLRRMSDANPVAPATPREAFALLTSGNRRFAAGTPRHPNQDAARRADTAAAQHPHAVLLGCSDSRLPRRSFSTRGWETCSSCAPPGTVGYEVLGSIEYGVSVLGCPLVVVLGHDACGAVAATRAAVREDTTASGHLRDVIERVTPSVLAAQAAGVSEDEGFIATHVHHTVDLIMDRSRELADQVASGHAAVVGLTYRLAEGTVRTVTSRGIGPLPLPAPGTASATAPAPKSR